jgi:hypothetical protein
MRTKSELYEAEQSNIVDTIINLLDLDDEAGITLYELDNDSEKQTQLMELAPSIRKYFTCTGIAGVKEPMKRPWLSIIKNVCKIKYKILICDYGLKLEDKIVRTKKYYFIKK